MDKERDVILDEITGVQDQPGDMIFESFESELFAGHPLASTILGSVKSVKRLSREQVLEFIARHYRPENMVLGVVGGVPWNSVLKWAERYFGAFQSVSADVKSTRLAPEGIRVFSQTHPKGIHQVHHITGCVAPGGNSKDKLAMTVLANLLGGPAMNCRLNLNIREKHGMAYHIEANHVVYQDTGVFNVYFGTDPRFHNRVERLVQRELDVVKNRALGTRQLHDAKQQLLGQIALGHDHGSTVLSGLAKTYLMYNRVETLDSLIRAIESLQAKDLLEVANTWLSKDSLASLTFTTPA